MVTARSMFRESTRFDQNLEHWEVSSLEDASGMFAGALAFYAPPFVSNLSVFDQRTFFDTACNPMDIEESAPASTITEVFGVNGCPIPGVLDASFSGPMNGWCINSDNVLLDYFAKTGLYTSEAKAPGACLNYCLPYMNMPGFAGMQYNGGSNIGKGYCRCYFDAGYLPSDLPQGSDFVNDNTGSGPVTGHNVQGGFTDGGQRCYSYSYIDYVDQTQVSRLVLLVD